MESLKRSSSTNREWAHGPWLAGIRVRYKAFDRTAFRLLLISTASRYGPLISDLQKEQNEFLTEGSASARLLSRTGFLGGTQAEAVETGPANFLR